MNPEPDRGEGGKFTSKVEDKDILQALQEHREPVATASEVAEVLGVSSETVRRRLTTLHEADRVGRKKVGARAVVWWVDEETMDAPAAPLKNLVGMLNETEAERARERSEEWRESFDREISDGEA
jgi:DNA-binding Lrp family transcriptional regulator